MTIFRTLLARGYFPKELPPSFSTEQFAKYANSKAGRAVLGAYVPLDKFTHCVDYELALPGLERRQLKVPHPASFVTLANLTAKHFGRLLKKASVGKFSKSRPVYSSELARALRTLIEPQSRSRERANGRAGASFLLQADVSHFYPSLYTHAIGWAIDPKLRKKPYWNNPNFLGKKIDNAVRNLDGKITQGIPIGNDISFLLAEIVLAQVDKALGVDPTRAWRWIDDYEMAFDSRDQAEAALRKLTKELAAFRLRLNQKKTQVVQLPLPVNAEWQDILKDAAKGKFTTVNEIIKYFDIAFRLRAQFPSHPILMYALGVLFKVKSPNAEVGRVAQSCISQSLLSEPGAAQKAFSLLSFWRLNGFSLDEQLLSKTICQMIMRHESIGLSSDISWALSFCLEHHLSLSKGAARGLSDAADDCIGLQSLHMKSEGLVPSSFDTKNISTIVKEAHLDREHWLLAYESVRHGFLSDAEVAVKSNTLFADLLKNDVTFYRTSIPPYSSIIHPGGAPRWLTSRMMTMLTSENTALMEQNKSVAELPVFGLLKRDSIRVAPVKIPGTLVERLLDAFGREEMGPEEDAGDY